LHGAEPAPPDKYDLNAEIQAGGRGGPRRPAPTTQHNAGLSPEQVQARAAQARNRGELLRQKDERRWFAALTELSGANPLAIKAQFRNWNELADFVTTNKALVEVWADPGGDDLTKARRIGPLELGILHKQETEQPTFVTVTARDPASGQVHSYKLEFAYDAAAEAQRTLSQRAAPGVPTFTAASSAVAPLVTALQLDGGGVGPDSRALAAVSGQASGEAAVVEQVVAAPAGVSANINLSPEVHQGTDAVDQRYTQVLADLQEWHHFLQKKALGLPMETPELLHAASALEDLAAKGVWIDDNDALLSVDAFNNSFVYRRYENGEPRIIKVTGIPARADAVQDVAKAEVTHRRELRERAAVSGQGSGLALVHRVEEVNGRPEVGELLLAEESKDGIDAIWALLDRLPVTNRARLRFDGSSRNLIEADFEGHGTNDRFYLTLTFPPGKTMERERVNPLTGEREVLVLQDGLVVKVITDTRITELDYGSDRDEKATRTYANSGSRQAPVKGTLLEETRTLETWHRDFSQGALDAAEPIANKSKINHVTGESTREICGLYPQPVATVGEHFITYREFNPYGILISATVFENGRTEADFGRPLLLKLNDPIVGRQRFQLSSALDPKELAQLHSLAAHSYVTTFQLRDTVKESASTLILDMGHQGRKLSEVYADRLSMTNILPVTVSYDYRNDFFFGQIPTSWTRRTAGQGKVLAQVQTRSYDPLARRLTGVETDYTGKVLTNIWDSRWPRPVEIQSPKRKTVVQFNHDETQFAATTILTASSEEVSRSSGHFDPKSQTWQVQRLAWLRQGITNRAETLTLSSAERVLASRTGDALERRPDYGLEGVEVGAHVFRKNSGTGRFDVLQEQEDNVQWTTGARDARVQRYIDGQPYDTFRRFMDVEGRVVQELREAHGLAVKILTSYDGSSDRPLRAEVVQNGQVRYRREWQAPERGSDGTQIVPVRVTPSWGRSWTERFRAGDPSGQPVSLRFEDGETVTGTQWYPGSDLARVIERRDRNGHLYERLTRRINVGMEGPFSYDMLEREKIGFWGAAVLVDRQAVWRGTDVPLFSRTPTEKIYYDLNQPFDAPAYAVDPGAQSGTRLLWRGEAKEHVLAVFRTRLDRRADTNAGSLVIDMIDLRQSAPHQGIRRTYDRGGRLLDERLMSLSQLSRTNENPDALFAAFDRAGVTERLHYRYQPGWLFEQEKPGPGKTLAFSSKRPESGLLSFPVNEGGHREFVTSIDAIKPIPGGGPTAELKNYFFREFRAPRQKELNPSLPRCTNLWTVWTARDLTPDGTKLSESELVCDAEQNISFCRTMRADQNGKTNVAVIYQLPEPDEHTWKELRLKGSTNSFPLDLGASTNLEGCDFLYLLRVDHEPGLLGRVF
jgi:hypothetical protein